jgi:regulatory protein
LKEEKPKKRILTPEVALEKARAYCVYQERCQSEVRNKLYEWGLWQKDVESLIAALITEGFLNEERFAKAYAGGKFRIKKWGKKKITIELKKKNISEYCIRKALQEINDVDYFKTLKEIIKKKSSETKEKNPFRKKTKLANYAISRGYDNEMVWDFIHENFDTDR